MPTLKKGQKEVRTVIDENSEIYQTLQEWARKRGLSLGTANRCILADWADALNGKPNPFAIAIAGLSTLPGTAQSTPATMPAQEEELSPEEKARQAALLEAADQFI